MNVVSKHINSIDCALEAISITDTFMLYLLNVNRSKML